MRTLIFNSNLFPVIIVALFSVNALKAQEENFNYCQKSAPWEDFIFDSTIARDKASILIVSNRPYLPDQKEFLINDIEHWRLVTYFLAYCESDKWHFTKVDSLKQGLDAINRGGDMLMFVHGHGKTFPEALTRSNLIKERYNVGMILFDWPSEYRNFYRSQARVGHCSENFYNLTLELKYYREHYMQSNQHLSLLAHSLGNYFLIQLILNGNNQYLSDVFFDNIIMNSAAITTANHGKVLANLKLQSQLYIVVNENDKVLRGAQLLLFRKMLGNFALPPLVPKAEYIHLTSVAAKDHTYFAGYHQYEYNNSSVFDFYNAVFHGLKPDYSQQNYYLKRSGGDGYDIVPSAISVENK